MIPVRAERWEGATAAELALAWHVPQAYAFERVGSTNDVARGLAERGAPSGTVVIAEEQAAGRGRGGRSWTSPPGAGIWMSLVLRDRAAEELPALPLAVGVAAARALDPFAGPGPIQLKWPNDLLLNGHKLGGILCEAVWEAGAPTFVIVGIGINVLQQPEDFPPQLRDSATSLRLAAGHAPARRIIAGALVRQLTEVLSSPVVRLEGPLAAELEARDALRGREVVVTGSGDMEPVRGTAVGMAADGALLVRSTGGSVRRIRSGSVRAISRCVESRP